MVGKVRARGRAIKRPEQALHIQVANYLSKALGREVLWWHTANGVHLTKVQAGLAKAMGMRAGIPDLFFLYGERLHAIELKAKAGRMSVAQEDVRILLMANLCRYATCRDLDQVENVLGYWGIPLKARLA